MENKLLTIIVPIFNKEKVLKQCLDSFAIEKFADCLEVLAIDDGSTDSSFSIAREYERKYPGIYKVIKKENGGVGSVMNLGLQYAKGKYVKEVDADDYIESNALGRLLDFLEKCNSDIVLTPFMMVDETGNHIETHYIGGVEYEQEYLADMLLGHVGISIQGLTIKTQLLLDHKITLEETRYYVDMQLIGESIYYAETYIVLNCVLYYYRCNQIEQSVSLINYVKNSDDFRRQTELSLERYSRAQKDEISPSKIKIMKDAACGYSEMLHIIYLMDELDRNSWKCKVFDGMLQEKQSVVYRETGKQLLIQQLRNEAFENWNECKDMVIHTINELKMMNNGYVSLGDVCSAVLDGDGNIAKYRLQKQKDKFRKQFQILNHWFMNYQKGITSEQYLWNKGFRKIAIYGFGALGERLYQELLDSQIQVVYGIDQRIVIKESSFQIDTLPDDSKEIDVIVVTVITDYENIVKYLKNKVRCPIISLEDVVYRSY